MIDLFSEKSLDELLDSYTEEFEFLPYDSIDKKTGMWMINIKDNLDLFSSYIDLINHKSDYFGDLVQPGPDDFVFGKYLDLMRIQHWLIQLEFIMKVISESMDLCPEGYSSYDCYKILNAIYFVLRGRDDLI
jgi:hypothetical protein